MDIWPLIPPFFAIPCIALYECLVLVFLDTSSSKYVSCPCVCLVQGESEVDETFVRHKPPTGHKTRRHRAGPVIVPGDVSEVTTTTTTTNSSIEPARQSNTSMSQLARGDSEGPLTRRSTLRRPAARANPIPDTTDDEAWERQPIRRPPARGIASKSNTRVGGDNFQPATQAPQGSSNPSQPPAGFRRPIADAGNARQGRRGSSGQIDIDDLPGVGANTSTTAAAPAANPKQPPPRRTFQFDEDDADGELEEIDAS